MNALNRFLGRDDGEEGQALILFAIMMLAPVKKLFPSSGTGVANI